MKTVKLFAATLAALGLSLSAAGQETVRLIPHWPAVNESLLYHVSVTECMIEEKDSTFSSPSTYDLRLTTEQITPGNGVLFRTHYENIQSSVAMTDEIRKDNSQFFDILKEEMSSALQYIEGYIELDSNGSVIRRYAASDAKEQIINKLRSLCGNRKDVFNMMAPMYESMFTQEMLDNASSNTSPTLFSLCGKELPLNAPVQGVLENSMDLPVIGSVTYNQRVIYNATYSDELQSGISIQILATMLPGESKRIAEAAIESTINGLFDMMGDKTPSDSEIKEIQDGVREVFNEMKINSSSEIFYLIDASTFLPKSLTRKEYMKLEYSEGKLNTLTTTVFTLE